MKAAALGLAFTAGLLAACGTPGGLPDPGPCPATDPALAPPVSRTQYTVAVFRALDQFQDADQDFRAAWPERRFRDRSSFKRDFVTFEHRTRCLSNDIVAAGTPDGLEDVVTDLHAYLALVNDSIAMGREAVESRNASAYRDWISEIDVLVVGYTDFQTRLQQAR
jgi:hypothetical protein